MPRCKITSSLAILIHKVLSEIHFTIFEEQIPSRPHPSSGISGVWKLLILRAIGPQSQRGSPIRTCSFLAKLHKPNWFISLVIGWIVNIARAGARKVPQMPGCKSGQLDWNRRAERAAEPSSGLQPSGSRVGEKRFLGAGRVTAVTRVLD